MDEAVTLAPAHHESWCFEAVGIPKPGDRHPGFIVEPMRCWAPAYDGTMQAHHCPETP